MRKLLLATALLCGFAAHAGQSIKPYDPKPQNFEVGGKSVTSAEATVAYLNGKEVKLCKAMSGAQSAKTFKVGGKEVKGSELTTCTVMELTATKNGTGFKVKK